MSACVNQRVGMYMSESGCMQDCGYAFLQEYVLIYTGGCRCGCGRRKGHTCSSHWEALVTPDCAWGGGGDAEPDHR
jgi:hypothetical protein